jgi:hypothetical protein
MASVVGDSYPIRTELDAPYEVARWRPFFAWVVAIPHFLILGVIGSVVGVLTFVGWFAILFTGRMPDGIVNFTAMYLRYQWRTVSYSMGFTEKYPPFEFEMTPGDDGHHTARFDLDSPDTLSRGLIWIKWLLIIPHVFVLCFVFIAAWFAYVIGMFAVLFTGKWPDGMRDFIVGSMRWSNRVNGYAYLVTDDYPPFSLQ